MSERVTTYEEVEFRETDLSAVMRELTSGRYTGPVTMHMFQGRVSSVVIKRKVVSSLRSLQKPLDDALAASVQSSA